MLSDRVVCATVSPCLYHTYMCSVTCQSSICTQTGEILIMEFVMSWGLLKAASNPDMGLRTLAPTALDQGQSYIKSSRVCHCVQYIMIGTQALCWNLVSGNKLTHNSSGKTQSKSPQLTEPLLTDPGLKSGNSVRELISALKKKKAQALNELSNSLPKSLHARKKLPPASTSRSHFCMHHPQFHLCPHSYTGKVFACSPTPLPSLICTCVLKLH